MAISNQQIIDFLTANPSLSDAQIATAMQEYSVTPAQMAQAVGLPVEVIRERYVAVAPKTETAENINKLASQILSQGTTEAWTGGLPPEKAALYMASDLAKSGVTNIEQITKTDSGIVNAMTGEKLVSGYGERTGGNLWSGSYEGKGNTGFGVNFDAQGKPIFYTQGASSSTLKNDILKLAAIAGAAYGLTGGFEGLFGGASALDAGMGVYGAGGSGLLTPAAAATGAGLEFAGSGGAFDLANAGIIGGAAEFTAAELAAIAAGTYPVIGAGTAAILPSTVVPPTGVPPVVPPTGVPPVVPPVIPPVIPPTGTPTVIPPLTKALIPAAVSGLLTPSSTGNLSNLISGGLTTAGSLLQQQASKEATLAAQQRIDAETAAAKQSAAFRPVGMTTRFGTSQFGYDPTTGQMTSAGYTLSPEAKAQQDRFVALSNQGLTQAEGAQAQFAPLQTGAQSLFSLGNQYISQSPESVAQNYLNQQMALLQPGRETELANLQNKLQQQGRGGLSVSQGGTMGATTPELQALYNARAQQEAVLAANAQQAGQQQVLYGAGLLGQGTTAMGNYYAGQQAAYAPYTAAQGQVQNLETLGQQPFNMSSALAQQTSTAGARQGQLGLTGAQLSTNLATSANATSNPYAQALMAAGNPNAMFGQTLNKVVGGLFNNTPATSGFSYGQYGTGVDPSTGEYFGSLYF